MKNNNLILFVLLYLVNTLVSASEKEKGLTISGYLDASYTQIKIENEPSEKNLKIDTVDLILNYQWNNELSFETHLVSGNDKDTELEQAYLAYQLTDNVKINVGKFLSIQGFEAYHAPDLYQYSTSATLVYPGMMNALSISFQNNMFTIYGAVMASAWDNKDSNFNEGAYEAAIKLRPAKGVNLHAGYVSEEMPNGLERTLTNIWGSYQKGNFITHFCSNSDC